MSNLKFRNVAAAVAALTVASSVAGAAVTLTAGNAIYGIEYSAAQATADATSSAVLYRSEALLLPTFTSDVAYAAGDIVTVTIGGTANAVFQSDGLNTAKLICAVAGTADDTDPEASAGGGDNAGDVISTKAQSSSSTIAFTLAAGKSCAAGTRMWIKNAKVLNSSLDDVVAGTVTFSIGATRNGTAIDSTLAPVVVATTNRELDVTIASGNAFNGIVDTTINSKAFRASAALGNDADKDDLTLTITNRDIVGATDSTGATDDSLVVSLSGDFSFMDDDADGCTAADLTNGDFQLSATVTAGAGAGAVTALEMPDCNTVRITLSRTLADLSAPGANSTLRIRINADGNGSTTYTGTGYLIAQTFTGTATLKYTTAGAVAAVTRSPAIAPGAFTSAGSTVFVPYMPAGVGFSQVLYITNNSPVAGTVTITGRDQNGVACSSANMGGSITVGPNRVVNLSNAIASGLANCWGGANVTNKLYMTITANLPDQLIEVYSAFNAGGSDRGTVINSSNGRPPAAGGMGDSNSTARQ